VSNVVETELGFHLIKVHEKKPEKNRSFQRSRRKDPAAPGESKA